MPKANEVATELRKLADALSVQPETEIDKPRVIFSYYEKEPFIAAVRLLPHPLTKKIDYPDEKFASMVVTYNTDAICISASAPRSKTCEIIEPAKPAVYDCPSLLSEEEEMGLVEK